MAVDAENFQVSPDDLEPGAEVNGWRILERLGTGGFGIAWRVESITRPGEFFALKIARRLADERVAREIALLMTRAIHPHVVRLHAFGRWPHPASGYLYFVMDWVPGMPLHTWAESLNPSVRLVVEKLAVIALTLEHLHAQGVLHRDLKPEHILIREADGRPMLIDFGVGWHAGADALTSQGMAPGTPHLRSPEAVAFWRKHGGKPEARYVYRPTDDVYALGVSAYRVLTGHWPFPPHLERDSLFAAIEGLVPPTPAQVNRRLPRPVCEVIQRMMARRPHERFSSCGEAHVALAAALSFAGSDAEVELFSWEKGPERRVQRPEWPTVLKSSSAPRRALPALGSVFRRMGGAKVARPEAPAPVAPEAAKPWWKRGARPWVLGGLVILAGLGALRGPSPRVSASPEIEPEQKSTSAPAYPTRQVGEKSSTPRGRKLARTAEWPEPLWAAVPIPDPTPAVVALATNPEDVLTVKTQSSNQVAGNALMAACAATLVGCASLPPVPGPGPCPKETLDAMEPLKLPGAAHLRPHEYLRYPHDESKLITVRDNERFVWGAHGFPAGTQFIGRLWVRERVYGRVDTLVTPSGERVPVCLELTDYQARDNKAVRFVGIPLAEPASDEGVGLVDMLLLTFRATSQFGDPYAFPP